MSLAHATTPANPPPVLEERVGHALLAASAAEGAIVCAADGRIEFCNAAAADLLNCDLPGVEDARLGDLLRRLGRETLQLRFQSALMSETALEFVVERPLASDEWIEVRALPLRPGMTFLLKDVSDRERSERTLRRKEQRLLAANRSLRLAHKAAHAASWEWRAGKGLRWLDLSAARQLVGLPPSWTEDDSISDWRSLMPADGQAAFDAAAEALAGQGEACVEVEVTGSDGERHWMKLEAAVTERAANGTPTRISGVMVDVTAAKISDEVLRSEVAVRKRAEERQQLLVHELNHRVKNMLATVQSVARQSLGAPEINSHSQDFEQRLVALAWAYEILTREQWAGAPLQEVLGRTMAPHAAGHAERVILEGPDLWLPPNEALAIAMATHELATNAVKYGGLSNDVGVVAIRWRVTPEAGHDRLELEWAERGGPRVRPPERRGFGSRLVERSLARELGGQVAMDFDPEGLRCRISAPVARRNAP